MDPHDPGSKTRDGLADHLRRLPTREAKNELQHFILSRTAELLQLDGPEDVDPLAGFVDLGFDSLRAVDFKILLEESLDCSLRTTLVFDYPTPDSLRDYLAEEVLGHGVAPGAATEDAPPAGARIDLDDLGVEELRALALRQQARLQELETRAREPVAIVGMGCRFPGGVSTPDEFWELQVAGTDAISEVPADRWPLDELYDVDRSAPGKIYTRYGGFLDQVDRFDARFFGISPREAMILDPQQRLLLEAAWETLEHAGISPDALANRPVGVFIGTRASEYFDSQCDRTPEDATSYYATGNAISTAAGRLSFFFGWTGPSYALDTACSGSLVAVHEAVRSLRSGTCNAALAGGVNMLIDPVSSVGICRANMLAADGRCKTFDAAADGYVRAEGCGLVLLKRVSDARRDGDTILAVIRGTAINQDGASGGLTVPNGPSQEEVIRAALANGRVAPEAVSYVEAHGTGTSLGDPIEVGALDRVFGEGRGPGSLPVGSVKTNVGHLESAAGIAGLMKVVLALRNESLPPLLHLQNPNPHIPWSDTVVSPVRQLTPWPKGVELRVAGVSSFGFSGTNAHVVIEEAPAPPRAVRRERPLHVVPLSARDPTALTALTSALAEHMDAHPDLTVDELASATSLGRAHLSHRRVHVVADAQDLRAALRHDERAATGVAGSQSPPVTFLFTGQGSQYAGMGRVLYDAQPVFREALDRCADVLRDLLDRPLLTVLWGGDSALLGQTAYTQPALFALEYALTQLWSSFGVEPDRVLGHSVGEYPAACHCGVFSLDDGLRLIAARGRLMTSLTRTGSMVVVRAAERNVRSALEGLEDRVSIAAVNGPANTVVSGDTATVEGLTRDWEREGIRVHPLSVSHAFHSPLMDPMLDTFAQVAREISYSKPDRTFLSCLDPGPVGEEIATPDYWIRHVRSPVRFADGIRALEAHGPGIAVEIGSRPVLLGMARTCGLEADAWLPSLEEKEDAPRALLRSVAEVHVRGGTVDWRGVLGPGPHPRAVLPRYPFQRERFWLSRSAGGSRSGERHPLLGRRLPSMVLEAGEILFEALLSERTPPWLGEHRVFDAALVPAAVFMELALSAGAAALRTRRLTLRNVAIAAPLVLEQKATTVQVLLTPDGDAYAFRVVSLEPGEEGGEDTWTTHASGRIAPLTDADAASDWEGPGADGEDGAQEAVDVAAFYDAYAEVGLDYGPAFRALRSLTRADGRASAEVRLGEELGDLAPYQLHPVLLDACFQACGAVTSPEGFDQTWLPIGAESVVVTTPPDGATRCRVRRRVGGERALVLDLRLETESGIELARVDGLQLVPASRAALTRGRDPLRDLLYDVTWTPRPRGENEIEESEGPGSWLLVGRPTGCAAELAAGLRARGHDVAVADPAAFDEGILSNGPPTTGIVHLAGVDEAEAGTDPREQELACGTALALARAVARAGWSSAPRMWLVTTGACGVVDEDVVSGVGGASLWGLGHVMALEHPEWRTVRLDLDPQDSSPAAALLEELLSPDGEDRIALRGDRRYGARLVRRASGGPSPLPRPAGPCHLRISEYGALENLELRPLTRREPEPGEVEIEVAAAALNFKDVLYALGLLKEWSEAAGIHRAPDQPLGFEGAGRVVSTGEGVTGLTPGDEVMVSVPGSLATHVWAPASHVVPVPAGVSLTDAAALQTVFVTSLYALERLAKVGRGDRVLIHAAAGGVGQAAVQLAQRAGAEVFATASPGKHAFLKAQGVAHIMSSRTLDFAQEILRLTDGRGVDVVLNSLTGDFITKSFEALAPAGRFVEIGKIGIWDEERVSAARPDASYFTFDMADLTRDHPELLRVLLRDLARGFEDGSLRPLPTKTFPVEQAPRAFGHLAAARNIGKVVLALDEQSANAAIEGAVRPDRSYLVTGGLGALGGIVARRLCEAGARHLVLAGRNPPDEKAGTLMRELEADGVNVTAAALDVACEKDVATLLGKIDEVAPLGGVIHAAGVLGDGMLLNLEWERFASVLSPKVSGTWNLHQQTKDRDLDFFVTFSSMVAILGNQGQAAYAAGNAFMDAVVAHRRARGLPGTTINWGPWSGGGMAASVASKNQVRFAEIGLTSLSPDVGGDALLRLLAEKPVQCAVLPIRWSRYLGQFRHGLPPFLDAFASAHTPRDSERSAILETLAVASADERLRLLSGFLEEQLARVLGGRPGALEPQQKFSDLGVDSLLAVDLRNRVETALACSLPATLLFDYPTLGELVTYLSSEVAPVAAPPPPDSPAATDDDSTEDLTEEELASKLAAEIQSHRNEDPDPR